MTIATSDQSNLTKGRIAAELRRYSLYYTMGHLFSPQNCPFLWGEIWNSSNTWFLGPTRVHNPMGISIGSAVIAGLTMVTDRATDRQTTLLGPYQ